MTSGRRKRGLLLAFCLLCAALFASLGVWQMERRAWKLDLIDRVGRRIHATPQPAPAPAAWPRLRREDAEYRRVRVRGVLLYDREALVRAVSDYGSGYWVMTPLRTDWGIVFVNRGFIPPAFKNPGPRSEAREAGVIEVEGLLRWSEPRGGFLRRNDPAHDRWYSRDVAALAASRALPGAAPYFIDASGSPHAAGWPKAGLTVLSFRNAHLEYALTWFGLALLSAVGAGIVVRRGSA